MHLLQSLSTIGRNIKGGILFWYGEKACEKGLDEHALPTLYNRYHNHATGASSTVISK